MKKKLDILFEQIKNDICQVYSHRIRGNTLEIITNQPTINNLFVSVFIKPIDDANYLISDGGWIDQDYYGQVPDYQDTEITEHVRYLLLNKYNVKTEPNRRTGDLFYNKVVSYGRISSGVFEMSVFIQSLVNAIHIEYREQKVEEEKKRFQKKVNDYLRKQYSKDVDFNFRINGNIRFNAAVKRENKLFLLNYITGSTPGYFNKNITEATVKFQMTKGYPATSKIAVLNDEVEGYVPEKSAAYLSFLKNDVGADIVYWKNKDRLTDIIL